MNKRGSYGSMADRVAAARDRPQQGQQRPPSSTPSASTDLGAAVPAGPPVKHCWVTDQHGRLPGLLLGWQQRVDGWYGRVVRPVDEGDGWVVVEEWLPAGLLDPVASATA